MGRMKDLYLEKQEEVLNVVSDSAYNFTINTFNNSFLTSSYATEFISIIENDRKLKSMIVASGWPDEIVLEEINKAINKALDKIVKCLYRG